jgi:hypothetical protein
MAGSLEGASGGLAGSGEELGSEWEVKSCGGSSVHSQVRPKCFNVSVVFSTAGDCYMVKRFGGSTTGR